MAKAEAKPVSPGCEQNAPGHNFKRAVIAANIGAAIFLSGCWVDDAKDLADKRQVPRDTGPDAELSLDCRTDESILLEAPQNDKSGPFYTTQINVELDEGIQSTIYISLSTSARPTSLRYQKGDNLPSHSNPVDQSTYRILGGEAMYTINVNDDGVIESVSLSCN